MQTHIQEVLDQTYPDCVPAFSTADMFHCERCNCTMLKSRCKERLEAIGVRKKITESSIDVNCLRCEQGRELTGLWVGIPYKLCSVPGCDRKAKSHGLCYMHYKREENGIKAKVCKTCGKDVALWHYHKNSVSPDGLQSSCKKCRNKKRREGYDG